MTPPADNIDEMMRTFTAARWEHCDLQCAGDCCTRAGLADAWRDAHRRITTAVCAADHASAQLEDLGARIRAARDELDDLARDLADARTELGRRADEEEPTAVAVATELRRQAHHLRTTASGAEAPGMRYAAVMLRRRATQIERDLPKAYPTYPNIGAGQSQREG